ncbi:MAG: two pore domain potassium channel family protein [Limimaricola sp.]|uniref:potassium channel family protein n=1 Tax=Limimaricola sp. TaxID=2211665 RepID=UPI001D914FC9|nr:potassium channel family protein [Limimaricola sp.]MBI1418050.1 two pore domain potassium channel family protein [Limimaricola sp.]
MNRDFISALVGTMVTLIVGGTLFFHVVEGWSYLDSYFFTVVTLSTVGYGDLVPHTDIGRIGTTVLIFIGLGVFAVAIQQLGNVAISNRVNPGRLNWWRRRNMRRAKAAEESAPKPVQRPETPPPPAMEKMTPPGDG